MPRKPGDIVIVRHGRPNLARKGWLTARQWNDWWALYEKTGLAPDQTPPTALCTMARLSHHLYSSTRPRAVETARRLAPEREPVQSALFVEANLPAPPLPGFVRFTPPIWGAICRVSWLLGYSGTGESATLARVRAKDAAAQLATLAEEGDVLLCAHGWFNRMMRPELRRLGWTCRRDGGDKYWSWRRYARKDI